jgi:hypothetical protein
MTAPEAAAYVLFWQEWVANRRGMMDRCECQGAVGPFAERLS